MTCVELQESLAVIEDGRSVEQRDHLKNCRHCSALLTDLILLASMAVELRGTDEPSPRVWNSIESRLRQDGLIRPQRRSHSLLPSFGSQWAWARWIVPAAAIVLLSIGLYIRKHSSVLPVSQEMAPAASDLQTAGLNDDDLLQEVAQQSPDMQAQYRDSLRRVNEYIQDAKGVLDASPNDEDARRSLLEAYQQKAMLFELAMDRSLQ